MFYRQNRCLALGLGFGHKGRPIRLVPNELPSWVVSRGGALALVDAQVAPVFVVAMPHFAPCFVVFLSKTGTHQARAAKRNGCVMHARRIAPVKRYKIGHFKAITTARIGPAPVRDDCPSPSCARAVKRWIQTPIRALAFVLMRHLVRPKARLGKSAVLRHPDLGGAAVQQVIAPAALASPYKPTLSAVHAGCTRAHKAAAASGDSLTGLSGTPTDWAAAKAAGVPSSADKPRAIQANGRSGSGMVVNSAF